MKTGFQRIEEERKRQLEVEGWKIEDDQKYPLGLLTKAAECYEEAAGKIARGEDPELPEGWPWDPRWWKPSSAERCLEKAGALYLADATVRRAAGQEVAAVMALGDAGRCGAILDAWANVDLQEEIVSAIWEFARAQRKGPCEGWCMEKQADGSEKKVPLNFSAADVAVRKIMGLFGVEPVEYGDG